MSWLGNNWLKLLLSCSFFGLVLLMTSGLFQHADAPARSQVLPLENATIVIDPGHGGIDPGCHRDTFFEKDIVLAVGLELTRALEAKGARVILTRAADIELSHFTDQESTRHRRDLRARVNMAEDVNADLLVSLHVNTAASAQLGGAMVFYHQSSPAGKMLAESILGELSHAVPGNQNGTLPANFFILRHSSMPSALVEIGFLSNSTDRAILSSPEGRQRIATAIVSGVEQFWKDHKANNSIEDQVNPTWAMPLPLLDDHPCLAI